MKSNQSIWDYYKDNLITPLSFVSDVGDNLDDDLPDHEFNVETEPIADLVQLKEKWDYIKNNLTPQYSPVACPIMD